MIVKFVVIGYCAMIMAGQTPTERMEGSQKMACGSE